MIPHGTYSGEKIQAVVTEQYTIVFIIEEVCARSYMLKTSDLSCVHAVRTTPRADGGCSINLLLTSPDGMKQVKGEGLADFVGKPVFEVIQKGGEYVWLSRDGETHVTFLYESFENDYLTPRGFAATKDSIAACLADWHLGVKVLVSGSKDSRFLQGIEINTPLHMFIYNVRCDYAYVRAARYSVCNEGMVFNQSFRQYFNDTRCHQRVQSDFLSLSTPLPAPDVSLYDNKSCTLFGHSLYWSVLSFDENRILLNGCGGDIYTFVRPGRV